MFAAPSDRRPRIALVSREVWPFVTGGGIGRHVSEIARMLAPVADVTIVTDAHARAAHEQRHREDPAVPPARFAWVTEPSGDLAPMLSPHQAWAAAARDVVLALAREAAFDLVEAEDFRGTAAALCEARRAGLPELATTLIAVRLHSTWEMIAALDEHPRDDLGSRAVLALERAALRFADVLLAPTCATLDAYRRFYGADALARAVVLRPAFVVPPSKPEDREPSADGPLRLLQVGRLQRHKGVEELVRALVAEPDLDVRLSLLGGDTPTGPRGTSMRARLETLAAGDPRLRFIARVPPEDVPAIVRAHDVVVAASRFEAFGYVAREALSANRPVLASPAGGMTAGFAEGRTGWLLSGTTVDALRGGLRELAARADEARALVRAGVPRAALEEWVAEEDVAAGYLRLADAAPAAPASSGVRRRVVAVVDANGLGDAVATTRALAVQTATVEVVIATADPAGVPAHACAEAHDLAAVSPGPLPRHRARAAALAIARARDAEVVVLLDAGDRPHPTFVARCLEALARSQDAAYVTTPGEGRDARNAPLGNAASGFLHDVEMAGTALAIRADALPLSLPAPPEDGAEDVVLTALLAHERRFGVVLPETLMGRVRTRWRDPRAAGRALAAATPPPASWAGP